MASTLDEFRKAMGPPIQKVSPCRERLPGAFPEQLKRCGQRDSEAYIVRALLKGSGIVSDKAISRQLRISAQACPIFRALSPNIHERGGSPLCVQFRITVSHERLVFNQSHESAVHVY